MLALRADPWDPGYGMGFDAPPPDEPSGTVIPDVESDDWSRPRAPGPGAADGPVLFVDGVMRIEVRLIAQDGDRRAPGLFGSWAAGCVRCDGRASFGDYTVGRALVVGGGMCGDDVEVPTGSERLRFRAVGVPEDDPNQPRYRLQEIMRSREAELAATLAAEHGALVLADGPLTFVDPTGASVVGIVKRFAKHYLDPDRGRLLARLGPGERTPLFAIAVEGQPVQRYSWYTRLVPMRAPWHDHAGIVRCEVASGLGMEASVALADRVSALLPRFAGRPSDPRAPQNLAPIGALESRLRHRMGDRVKVARALTGWLVRAEATS